jgi:hypothetical protein
MVLSFLFLAFRALLGALVRSRRGLDLKDIELLVLRHELEVLRRQVARPKLRPADRVVQAQRQTRCLRADGSDLAQPGGCREADRAFIGPAQQSRRRRQRRRSSLDHARSLSPVTRSTLAGVRAARSDLSLDGAVSILVESLKPLSHRILPWHPQSTTLLAPPVSLARPSPVFLTESVSVSIWR